MHQEFAQAGYVYSLKVMNSAEYGGTEKRIRAWIIAIEIEESGMDKDKAMDVLRNCEQLLKRFHSPSDNTDFHHVLLKPKDSYVSAELKRLIKAKEDKDTTEQEKPVWKDQIRQLLDSKGISASQVVAPPEVTNSPWFSVLPKREQHLIATNMTIQPAATSFDASQMPNRCFVGFHNVLNTVATGAHIWDVKGNRLLLGRELLNAHGIPYEFTEPEVLQEASLTDRNLVELAGNSFAGNVFAAVLIAILTFFPHEHCKPGISEQEYEEQEMTSLKRTESFLDRMLSDIELA